MNEQQNGIDHAVARLRVVLDEHERSEERDTPLHLGIRRALEELDAFEAGESSAA